MENYDKHHLALGLRPGATHEEIRSAFRRMAILYHPDKDPSTYAEMRYHEARLAYDALRRAADVQPSKPSNFEPTWTRQTTRDDNSPGAEGKRRTTACGTGWYAHEADDNYDFSDLFYMYGTQGHFKERIPFSFREIPVILWESSNEAADIGMFVRFPLHVAAVMVLLGWLGFGWLTSSATVVCSLFGFAFFRYYVHGEHPAMKRSKVYAYLMGSLLYCTGAGLSVYVFNPGVNGWYFAALMFCAVCLLWAHVLVLMFFFVLFSLFVYPVIWLGSF